MLSNLNSEGGRLMAHIYRWLDEKILPWPVRVMTNRLTILATMGLFPVLLIMASATTFVLAANSYLNTASTSVAMIVLLWQLRNDAEGEKRYQAQEHRARVDHEAILALVETQRQEIRELKEILGRACPLGASNSNSPA